VRYIGGFGRMSWVEAADFRAAEPDPLAIHAESILEHMNADHADANLAYARAFTRAGDATAARMTAVDRHGFDLMVDTPAGAKPARIAFEKDVTTPQAARAALVALVKQAKDGPGDRAAPELESAP
jgi:heme iron utilization protein